ncbi:MAG: AbrB/MazE/SpoVT family DNA-binding domain-containing protein [Alphaproteobacteria bacterium]|nr:AbrB/MazE/SpoVT family DNA-binding domain-containing protein [Alphaproteobacteria bacterium]MCW5741173.1 AbrB/MazE/SpoVT family DNA-binding domain-containing protein [Alphaproteobacteria bacterium]
MRLISRITSKGQITIPKAVRSALGLQDGDLVSFALGDQQAVLHRIAPQSEAAPGGAVGTDLTEWASPADEDAYRDL